ncbi:MAG: hypothetical protein KC777_02160 [Cyanobacteria bacterium HKST-UBA02]|nr:hypothetical protein [Cyanobacteria bacterium HKST-UBA02]
MSRIQRNFIAIAIACLAALTSSLPAMFPPGVQAAPTTASSTMTARKKPSGVDLTASYASPGRFSGKKQDLTLTDSRRGKELEIAVHYPTGTSRADESARPLIIFSHGAFGSKDAYEPLVNHFVSHGYVCIQPTHEDSLQLLMRSRQAQGQSQRLAHMRQEFSDFKARSFANWRSRPLDVTFILDSLAEIEGRIPGLKIDRNRIGIGGHSFGAHTAQVIGGTVIGGSTEFEDRRPRAVLLLSPQGIEAGFGGSALTEDSWKSFKRPMMTITGTRDKGRHGDDYQWRLDPYKYSPKGDKFLVVIEDAQHGLGGISTRRFPQSGPDNPAMLDAVKAASLAFFDAYLGGSEQVQGYLKSRVLQSESKAPLKMWVK